MRCVILAEKLALCLKKNQKNGQVLTYFLFQVTNNQWEYFMCLPQKMQTVFSLSSKGLSNSIGSSNVIFLVKILETVIQSAHKHSHGSFICLHSCAVVVPLTHRYCNPIHIDLKLRINFPNNIDVFPSVQVTVKIICVTSEIIQAGTSSKDMSMKYTT